MHNANLAGKLFSACRETATVAHVAHLSTTSYAHHLVLGMFYSELPDRADAFIEGFQGCYGLIGTFPDAEGFEKPVSNDVDLPTRLRDWIDANRAQITDRPELLNLIDEIVGLCNSVIYKLTHLQ